MPSPWLLFDRIRALAKQHRIYQADRVYQDQSSLDRAAAGGDFSDNSVQAAILDQTNLQINRLERYKDYEQMDQTGEINLALDLYADEASLVDPERKHTIIIRARNRRLKMELEDFFFDTLLWDTYCRPTIRYLCKYGDMPFEIIPTEHRDGVASLRFMNVYNFTRIETRFGDLVGFFHQDDLFPQPQFLHPWQVMHLRLTSFENIYHPYGRAVLDGGRKAFKQLRLMEDAALIYRITRAPEKRKFFIPVGLIPPKEVPEYMQMIARMFKRQRFYNPTTGTFDERYSPLIQEDDFLLPRRPDGSGPDIDVLPGAENLDQIADIEYFKKKMIAPTKIPYERVGIGEGGGASSEKSLSQSHSEFAKAVQWVQREVATGLKKVAIVHLALRGYSVEDLKGFDIALTATSAMEELYRIETWQTRAGVMAELKDLGWFPKEWIVTHFTDLSPDEIEELKDMEGEAAGGGSGGGIPGGLDVPDEGGETPEGMPDTAMMQDPDDPDAGGVPLDLGEEDDEMAMERFNGLDINAQRRVLQEMVQQGKRRMARKIMEGWAERLGRSSGGEEITHSSGFSHLLTMKELDGLTAGSGGEDVLTEDQQEKYIITEGLEVINPNNDDGLLVEWSVPKDLRDETIKEVFEVITLGDVQPGGNESEEITEDDLPETNVTDL
jgi:hypothetical protein